MAKKQVFNPTSVTGASPAPAKKSVNTRTRNGKHSKAAVAAEKQELSLDSDLEQTPSAAVIDDSVLIPSEMVSVTEENPLQVISRLAYGYWEARGGQGGDSLQDWVRAEEEYRRSLAR